MPKDGLDDRWFGLDGTIGKAARTLAWHDFRADRGGRACGPQSDALLTCPLRPDPGWLPKYASYRADGFPTDGYKLGSRIEDRY